jgi:cbb3-type cytochrome oxidase maturation protein
MEILYLLIPLSVALAFLIGAAFWWSVASGQFEDLEGPAHRILIDEDGWPASPERGSASDAGRVDLHQDRIAGTHLPSVAFPSGDRAATEHGETKERNR